MNKKLVVGFLASATFGAVLLAAPTNAAAEDNRNMTTDGSITFYKDNKPGTGPFVGNLSFAYVPAEFDFGANNATGIVGAKTYNQVKAAGAGAQYLAVSDDRANKKDWTVSATLDTFKNGTDELKADLSFTVGDAQKYNINAVDSDAAKTPTPAISSTNALEAWKTADGTVTVGGTNKTVTLPADSTSKVDVLSYKSTTSPATTVGAASEISDVQLKVKDHSTLKEAKYTSTVKWSLSSTVTDE